MSFRATHASPLTRSGLQCLRRCKTLGRLRSTAVLHKTRTIRSTAEVWVVCLPTGCFRLSYAGSDRGERYDLSTTATPYAPQGEQLSGALSSRVSASRLAG